MENKYW